MLFTELELIRFSWERKKYFRKNPIIKKKNLNYVIYINNAS